MGDRSHRARACAAAHPGADRDYRVPIGEALRLWCDLVGRHEGDPSELPHRFLYFPDENHRILTPGNAVTWYETVLAFLAHHVLATSGPFPRSWRDLAAREVTSQRVGGLRGGPTRWEVSRAADGA